MSILFASSQGSGLVQKNLLGAKGIRWLQGNNVFQTQQDRWRCEFTETVKTHTRPTQVRPDLAKKLFAIKSCQDKEIQFASVECYWANQPYSGVRLGVFRRVLSTRIRFFFMQFSLVANFFFVLRERKSMNFDESRSKKWSLRNWEKEKM